MGSQHMDEFEKYLQVPVVQTYLHDHGVAPGTEQQYYHDHQNEVDHFIMSHQEQEQQFIAQHHPANAESMMHHGASGSSHSGASMNGHSASKLAGHEKEAEGYLSQHMDEFEKYLQVPVVQTYLHDHGVAPGTEQQYYHDHQNEVDHFIKNHQEQEQQFIAQHHPANAGALKNPSTP